MSKINNYVINEVERVEKEFKSMEYDVLFNMVYDLIMAKDNYYNINDMDKFDYLVDSILTKQGFYNN